MFDLLHEHVTVCRETVDCEYCLVVSVRAYVSETVNEQTWLHDLQPENLWCITRLNLVSYCLTRVPSNDGEVLTGNGENGATVVAVRVEVTHLRCGLAIHTVGDGRG